MATQENAVKKKLPSFNPCLTKQEIVGFSVIGGFFFLATGALSEVMSALDGYSTEKWFSSTIATWIVASVIMMIIVKVWTTADPKLKLVLLVVGFLTFFYLTINAHSLRF